MSKSQRNPRTAIDKQPISALVADGIGAAAPALAPGFWRGRPLTALSPHEWEVLCDGCAKCCLLKLEDASTRRVLYTNVRCRLLDADTCRCTDYPNRAARVPDCMILTPENIHEATWLPRTCAYRLLATGGELPDWHPLVSGNPLSVLRSGNSIRGRTIAEDEAGNPEHHVVTWIR